MTERWKVGQSYRGVFADPDIVRHDGRWYAFATNTSLLRLPALVSRNLTHWQPVTDRAGRKHDALPAVGDWVTARSGGQGLWAPAVGKVGNGWTAAYSAQQSTVRGSRHNCIGLARATRPQGPYRQLGSPLECAKDSRLGAIDPDIFTDPQGRSWMLWKFSGIDHGAPSAVRIRRLNSNGTGWAAGSKPTTLIKNDYGKGWEGETIENPSMITLRGTTYLFFSAHNWETTKYATGYAICATPQGPCRKQTQPLLTSASTGNLGPGGAAAFGYGEHLRLIYHAWAPGRVGALRRMYIATLRQGTDKRLSIIHAG